MAPQPHPQQRPLIYPMLEQAPLSLFDHPLRPPKTPAVIRPLHLEGIMVLLLRRNQLWPWRRRP